MKVLILFLVLFEFATALNTSEIIHPGKSIVAFENFGTLNEGVKVAFAKLTLDSSVVISTMEEFESELNVLQNADLSPFQKGNIERLSQSMELTKDSEERMKRNLKTVEVKEVPVQNEDFVIEVSYDFRPDPSSQTEGYQEEDEFTNVSTLKFLMKMMDLSSAVSDVNSVLDGQLFLSPLNDQARKQYEDAIEKIKEKYIKLVLHEVRAREPIITKFENGVIEAYVPFHMINTNEEINLFRLLKIPLVFNNEVFIQIEGSSVLGIQKTADTTKYYFFEKDEISNCISPKRWYEEQRYLCRQSFETQESSKIARTCEGALYLKSHKNIKKACLAKFTKPSNLAIFLNQDTTIKYLIFTPPYEDILLECDGEKSPLEIRLENFQLISDSGSCTLVEQKWKMFSSYLHLREGIVISRLRDHRSIGVEIREIEDSEIESIWPELASAQFRENIIKEKSNVTNSVIYKRDEL